MVNTSTPQCVSVGLSTTRIVLMLRGRAPTDGGTLPTPPVGTVLYAVVNGTRHSCRAASLIVSAVGKIGNELEKGTGTNGEPMRTTGASSSLKSSSVMREAISAPGPRDFVA